MKIGAIILARLDSSRLPGKALIKINDRELILRVVDVCSRLNGIKEVIVATTTRDVDTPLAEFIEKNGINCFRGDYQNVAKRFLDVMSQKELDAAIRLNGDSPFQRPFLINQAINIFLKGGYDLVTNVPGRRYPHGMSVEIISKKSIFIVFVATPDFVLGVAHAKAKPLALFVQFQSDALVKPATVFWVNFEGSSATVPGLVFEENGVKVNG